MGIFYDLVDEKTKKEADELIELLKTNVISKRILPNKAKKYPFEKAFESAKNFVKSEDFKGLIHRAYDKNE